MEKEDAGGRGGRAEDLAPAAAVVVSRRQRDNKNSSDDDDDNDRQQLSAPPQLLPSAEPSAAVAPFATTSAGTVPDGDHRQQQQQQQATVEPRPANSGGKDSHSNNNGERDAGTLPVVRRTSFSAEVESEGPPTAAVAAKSNESLDVASKNSNLLETATPEASSSCAPDVGSSCKNPGSRAAKALLVELLDDDNVGDGHVGGSSSDIEMTASAAKRQKMAYGIAKSLAKQPDQGTVPSEHGLPRKPKNGSPTKIVPGRTLSGVPLNNDHCYDPIRNACPAPGPGAGLLPRPVLAAPHAVGQGQLAQPEYFTFPPDFQPTWKNLIPPRPAMAPPTRPTQPSPREHKYFQLSLLNVSEFTIAGLPPSYDSPPTPITGLRAHIRKISHGHGRAVFERDKDNAGGGKWRIPLGAYHAFVTFLISDPRCKLDGIPDHQLQIASLERARQEKGYPSAEELADRGVPRALANSLAPFQRGGVDFVLEKKGRALIGDDMGCGKTIQGIAAMSVYHCEWPLLVFCPSSARYHWSGEFARWLGRNKSDEGPTDSEENSQDDRLLDDSQIHVLTSSKDEILPSSNTRVVVCSHSLAARVVESGKVSPGLFKCAIVDESHMLKSKSSKRTLALVPILKATKRCVLLSGTPALAKPAELWPQLEILRSAEARNWWANEEEYMERYVKRGGAREKAELHTLLTGTVMIRRMKGDILKGLPPKTRSLAALHVLTPKECVEFKQLLAELRESKGALGRIARAHHARAGADNIRDNARCGEDEAPTRRTAPADTASQERSAGVSTSFQQPVGLSQCALSQEVVDPNRSYQNTAVAPANYYHPQQSSSEKFPFGPLENGRVDNFHDRANGWGASTHQTFSPGYPNSLLQFGGTFLGHPQLSTPGTLAPSLQQLASGSVQNHQVSTHHLLDLPIQSHQLAAQYLPTQEAMRQRNQAMEVDGYSHPHPLAAPLQHGALQPQQQPPPPPRQQQQQQNEESSGGQRTTLLSRLYGLTGTAKIPLVVDMLRRWLQDPTKGKLCIFAHHLSVLDAIQRGAELSNKEGSSTKFIRIDGSTHPKQRQQEINTFQTVPSVRIAVLGITAAGVAVTLTASSTVWFAELFWTPAIMIQAEDRCHRIGQQARVQCLYFVARGTLDEVLWKLLEKKFRNLGEFVEGKEKQKIVVDKTYKSERDLHAIFETIDEDDEVDNFDVDDDTGINKELKLDNDLVHDIEQLGEEERKMLQLFEKEDDDEDDDGQSGDDDKKPSAVVLEEAPKVGASVEDAIALSDDDDEEGGAENTPSNTKTTASARNAPYTERSDIPSAAKSDSGICVPLQNCRFYKLRMRGPKLGLVLRAYRKRIIIASVMDKRSCHKPAVGDILVAIDGHHVPFECELQEVMGFLRKNMERPLSFELTFAETPSLGVEIKSVIRKDLAARNKAAADNVIELLDDD